MYKILTADAEWDIIINNERVYTAIPKEVDQPYMFSLADLFNIFEKNEFHQKEDPWNMFLWLHDGNLRSYYSNELIEDVFLDPSMIRKHNGEKVYCTDVKYLLILCFVLSIAKTNNDDLSDQQKEIAKDTDSILDELIQGDYPGLINFPNYEDLIKKIKLIQSFGRYFDKLTLKWALRLPLDFYAELFRLTNQEFDYRNFRRLIIIAHWTKKIISARFPKQILENLTDDNPDYNKEFLYSSSYQNSTKNIGNELMQEYVSNVMFLMSTCGDGNIRNFWRLLARATGQSEIIEEDEAFKIESTDEYKDPDTGKLTKPKRVKDIL